jgi:hypothetical protein
MDKFKGEGAEDVNIEERIHEASSFEELYAALDEKGTLIGKSETYSSLMLKNIIDMARKAVDDMGKQPTADLSVIKGITRTAGLRNKVIDLLAAETTPNRAAILANLKSS